MSLSVSVTASSTSATFDRFAMAEKVAKRMMNDLDTDKSGTLDKNEFVAGLKAKGVSVDAASRQFDAIDTQKSGKISQADLQSAIQDGRAGPPPGGKPPAGGDSGRPQGAGAGGGASTKTYEAADTNKDGIVSSQEQLIYSIAHPSKASSASAPSDKLGTLVDTTA